MKSQSNVYENVLEGNSRTKNDISKLTHIETIFALIINSYCVLLHRIVCVSERWDQRAV